MGSYVGPAFHRWRASEAWVRERERHHGNVPTRATAGVRVVRHLPSSSWPHHLQSHHNSRSTNKTHSFFPLPPRREERLRSLSPLSSSEDLLRIDLAREPCQRSIFLAELTCLLKETYRKRRQLNREEEATVGKEMSSDGGASQIGVAGALGLSVTSSVAIVICNKYLISTLGFFFATTLTSWHLMVTFCTLHVAQRLRFFEAKPIDAQTVISFGLLNGISIGLLNLCLGFNSVGFYQMTKLAIIPFTVLLETIFLSKKFSKSIKAALMVLLLGVGIASVTDLQLNLLGSIIAVLTIAATCVSQILTNQIQRRLKVSSTQLLYQSSPYQSAVLLFTGPFVDKLLTKRDVFAFDYTFQVVAFIMLSCSIAVCVNFSTFLVIGTTSPVTYQVLGHLKTCLILSFGYVLLRDPFTFRNVAGILIAMFGMGLYSFFSVSESRKKTEGSSLPVSTQMSEKDSAPLLSATKSSPWQESKGVESFDDVPRTAKSAFSRQVNA